MPLRRAIFLVASLTACLIASRGALTETITVPRTGEYAKIDVRLLNETLHTLTNGSTAEKAKAIEAVKATPAIYAPPVFYAMSNVLFQDGQKDWAAFWFYAGQLRARYDANRCADVSARQAVAVLNQRYGPQINKYAFANLDMLEGLIPRVMEWDKLTPHKYDHRWINIHGMGAIITGMDGDDKKSALSLPESQWAEIKEKTRADYLRGFQDALIEMKKRKQ
jgi:hypothetical protein